jgi:hypothetical protein
MVRLTRKLAERLNGLDVSHVDVGDVLDLPDETANMLLAERWAEPLTTAPAHLANDQPPSSGSSRTRKPKQPHRLQRAGRSSTPSCEAGGVRRPARS